MRVILPVLWAAPLLLLLSASADAQELDNPLGTVDVDGSAGSTVAPLPKLAVVPLLSLRTADAVAEEVARRDLSISGEFELVPDAAMPPGPHLKGASIDLEAWRQSGAEYVVRVYSEPGGGGARRLAAEVFLTRSGKTSGVAAAEEDTAKATFRTSEEVLGSDDLRMAAHRLVDALLGALTGRPGGFASSMVFTAPDAGSRRAFVIDSDGSNLRGASPPGSTCLSPVFGPGAEVWYAISRELSPFGLAFGADAMPVPIPIHGSVMGLAFSRDRSLMALTVMTAGQSKVYLARDGRIREIVQAPFANHPAFGPGDRVAFVAGSPVQRIYVDQKPVSPAGLMASSPVFCDTPQGLLLFYTVKVGNGSDVVASNPNGSGLRRYTRQQGENRDPACSPDGRLIAFFSTRATGQGPGLYVAPSGRPWMARKVSSMAGATLRWDRTRTPSAIRQGIRAASTPE